MRWSQMLIPTLRECPAKEASHTLALMARAGYARLDAGRVTAYLPLGQKCLRKIENLVRRQLLEKGGQEFSPRPSRGAQEAEEDPILWQIASDHLRSYKELPQLWFYAGFQASIPRPSYSIRSFLLSAEEPSEFGSGDAAWVALSEVIRECGLHSVVAQAAPDPRREMRAQEQVVLSPEGGLRVARCPCGYSSNLDCAISRPEPIGHSGPSPEKPRLVETPGKKTIADVSEFLGVPPSSVVKSLLYMIGSEPVLALVRGDDQLNETLLCQAVGSSEIRPAGADEVKAILGADPGSIGPVTSTRIRILADRAVRPLHNLVCGANKDGYHLTGVEPERNFHAGYFDLRLLRAGDACRNCGHPLSIEQGHLLLRSSSLRHVASGTTPLRVLGADNTPHALSANIHTLDLDALLLALVEELSDKDGLVLPRGIAPFDAVITPISYRDENQRQVCDTIYNSLVKERVDVLLDDRDCSPGVKFKDADLIGVPLRITVGPNKLKEGKVELRSRRTRECFDCAVEEVLQPALRHLAT